VHALEAEGFQLRRAEQARGFIITGYHERSPEVVKKLGEIGDLSAARQAGLGRVSELEVTYQLFLLPADEGTRLKITSTIEAIDRSEAIFLGPGILQVIPRRITIPSRGACSSAISCGGSPPISSRPRRPSSCWASRG